MKHYVFDSILNGNEHIDRYREWTVPGTYPHEPYPRLENWHPEDLTVYCGGEFIRNE